MSDVKTHKKNDKLQRESIKVMIRFRPHNKAEKIWNKQNKKNNINHRDHEISYMPQNQIKLFNTNGKRYQYGFDTILTPSTTQRQAFEIVAEGVCDEILQGYNGTIFVYGQSGSGKTHTMYHNEEKKDAMDISSFGIIPMSCAYIFTILNDNTHPLAEDIVDYNVRCEFIEIYNERLRDLLNPKQTPCIREVLIHKKYVPIMQNVTTEQVNNLEECMAAIRTATSNRTTARTNLNATSSRSHMVMRLIVTIQTTDGMKKTGIANYADLAGSEKVKKTGVKGLQLKEAGNILKSLLALSNVIDALEKRRKHVPFKDSKLTFMLKNSLGGNCLTTLLLCASPSMQNREETIRSIQFGMRCRNVQNVVCINEVRSKRQLIVENEKLKQEISALKCNVIAAEEIVNEKLHEIEMDNFDLLKQNETSERNIEVLRQQIQQMSVERDEGMERENELNNELEIAQGNYTELKLNLNSKSLSRDGILEYEQHIEDYKINMEGLGRENEGIRHENKELNMKNEELKVVVIRLKEEIMALKEKINGFRFKYGKLQNENSDYEKRIVLLKSDLKQKEVLTTQVGHLKQELMDLHLKHELEKETFGALTVTQDVNEINEILNELNDEKNKSELKEKEYNKLLLKFENIMIELKNEKNNNENLEFSMNKFEIKTETLTKEKYEIEDKHRILFAEYNELEKTFNAFQQNINIETNKYTQNITKLKYRVDQQGEDNVKLFSKLKNIEKSQVEHENAFVNKLEELEIQTEEQENTIKQLNAEITKLQKINEELDKDALDNEIIEEKQDNKTQEQDNNNTNNNYNNEEFEEKYKEEKEQTDWDFIFNHGHARTRSSAFVRIPTGFTVSNISNKSHINLTKPKNNKNNYTELLYDDDGDADELDKLEVELTSNISGLAKYRRKKRKKYKKRNVPKSKTIFDTAELNKYKKLLSPRSTRKRKLSKSERIVRQQTLSLGNFFENHLQLQKQKDERMEKVFDAMEKRKASVHRNKSIHKNNKESPQIVIKSLHSPYDKKEAENTPEAMPKLFETNDMDEIYGPIVPILEQNKNILYNPPQIQLSQIPLPQIKLPKKQHSQPITILYNNMTKKPNNNRINGANLMNRSVSQRTLMPPYRHSVQPVPQVPTYHKHSSLQHNHLSQHISNKHYHSYSAHAHNKNHTHLKKKKRKSKKERKEESAKLALIYDNEYKAMKRRYQQRKRKRLLSKTNADNIGNNRAVNNNINAQSVAADAYDSDHNDSQNVPL